MLQFPLLKYLSFWNLKAFTCDIVALHVLVKKAIALYKLQCTPIQMPYSTLSLLCLRNKTHRVMNQYILMFSCQCHTTAIFKINNRQTDR